MSTPKMSPPWEFLLSASRNSLQSFEPSRLSNASNLRKEIAALLDQWLEENATAMLARLLLKVRERSSPAPNSMPGKDVRNEREQSVSDNILADRTVPPNGTRGST